MRLLALKLDSDVPQYRSGRSTLMEIVDNKLGEPSAEYRSAIRGKRDGTRAAVSKDHAGVRCLLAYPWWKNMVDRVSAFLAIIALSPLLALIAIWIRLDSPGNPLFRQERVGKNGRRFILYKFRSMYMDHDDSKYKAFLHKYLQENVSSRLDEHGQDVYQLIRDPRVTRVGRLLRKTNLDELPQLFNIMKGEMSFIGPRPDIPFAVQMYKEHHWKRFDVTPGITGLWQTSGRKNLSFEDMVRLDVEYASRRSLLLDIKIVLATVRTVLGMQGS